MCYISVVNWETSGVRIQNITMQPYLSWHLCQCSLICLFPEKCFTCLSTFLDSYLVFPVSVSFQDFFFFFKFYLYYGQTMGGGISFLYTGVPFDNIVWMQAENLQKPPMSLAHTQGPRYTMQILTSHLR